jgi:hypothetical protein
LEGNCFSFFCSSAVQNEVRNKKQSTTAVGIVVLVERLPE